MVFSIRARRAAYVCAAFAALLLAGCGGGGAVSMTPSGGTPNPAPTVAPTITLTMSNAQGATANLTAASPATLRVALTDKAGKPAAGVVVTFATDASLAVFSPASGTALTGSDGVAVITLNSASAQAGGAAKVTAAASVDGVAVNAQTNFSVGATALTLSALRFTDGDAALADDRLKAYGSMTVAVDVMAGNAKYVDQPLVVTFASACAAAGKATFAVSVPTNKGTAQAVYRDQGCATDDTVTATVTGASNPSARTVRITAPEAASVQFLDVTPADKSIVIKGAGGVGRSETATLQFKVLDTQGNALPNQNVVFDAVPAGIVTLNKLEDITDGAGLVSTTVNSGAVPGSFRVRATLKGKTTSTLSDTVVVSTGVPVQRALSVSASAFNVEGWDVDNEQITILALLADTSGNPVADGLPISFQTNLGAIGSADRGACTTVNGGCTVTFRSQNPRSTSQYTGTNYCNTAPRPADMARAGVATICATTTDGANTLYQKINVYLSSGQLGTVYINGAVATSDMLLPSFDSSGSALLNIQVNDTNNNPMPAGTKVELSGFSNVKLAAGTGAATVPNVAPTGMPGPQGTTHSFTLVSNVPADQNLQACVAGVSYAARFSLVVTTKYRVQTFPLRTTVVCR